MKKLVPLLLIFAISINANAGYYYFHDDTHPYYPDAKLMDASPPSGTYISYINIDERPAIWATLPMGNDTKISGDVTVGYWVEAYTKINVPTQIRVLKLYLVDISPEGNVDVIASTSPRILFFLKNNTLKSDNVYFENVEYILPANHFLGIKIEKVVDLSSFIPLSILSTFFDTNILYDSLTAKSYALIPLNISEWGINIECFTQEKSTKPGRSATYNLYIYNNGPERDLVKISTNYSDDWLVEINPEELFVDGKGYNTSIVSVTPPYDAKEGDYLNITIVAQGNTGYDSIWLNTTVTSFKYGVDVIFKEKNVEGELGKNLTIQFEVKNTGDTVDTYKLKVISNWSCSLEEKEITLDEGKSKSINLTVEIPKNAKSGEIVEVVAESANAKDSDYVTISPIIPEEEGKGNIGFILFIAFTAILLFIAYYIGKETGKSAIITCDERSIELPPGGKGGFSIYVQNPSKKSKRYKVQIGGKIPAGWKIYSDKQEFILDSGEKEKIKVNVIVPKEESVQEWASIDFIVIPEKGKKEKINMLVTLREKMPVLNTEIQHEPKDFSEGEKVITRVRIENTGEVEAENKKVILIVNGKEKNRVEGINIPPNSIVEIEIPWFAEKENNVEIKIE
ncbi:MAG: hypothetical protein H5T44_02455 [Thermoplasmatales archaeon]|nr:hypothetical protein [Thermoplasmatales archaeon]